MNAITVIIESPFAGDQERNKAYAKAAMLDSLNRGEAPFISHLLYTQVLDDTIPEQRTLGIEAGLAFGRLCAKTVVYTDFGISHGMELGIESAKKYNRPIEYRTIPEYSAPSPEEVAAKIYGIKETRLYEKTRNREVVECRQILMNYRNQTLGHSLAKSAGEYGMDHASAIHANKTVSDLKETNKAFKTKYKEFYNQITNI